MVLVVGLKMMRLLVSFIFLFPLLQGISNAFKWMKEMKETEDGMNEKMGFLDGIMVAFRDEIHTDILVKSCDGPPIPTHRALLVSTPYLQLKNHPCCSPIFFFCFFNPSHCSDYKHKESGPFIQCAHMVPFNSVHSFQCGLP